jgi:hypothetical protein
MNTIKRTLAASVILAALAAGCGDEQDAATDEAIAPTTSALVTGTPVYDKNTICSFPGQPLMHCCPPGLVMAGLDNGQNVLKCKRFAEFLTDRFVDLGTQATVSMYGNPNAYTTMHVCPTGSVMVGLHGSSNRFVCQRFIRDSRATSTFRTLDIGTQDPEPHPADVRTMHVCSEGLAMFGAHLGKNQFACFSDQSTTLL